VDFGPTVLAFAQTVTTQVGSQLLTEFGQVQASQKEEGTPVFGYVHLPPLAQSFHGFWSVSS